MTIEEFFQKYPRVAIAFSGGVDSAYLLYAAKQYAEAVTAYYVKSAFQPEFELADAKRLAAELGVELKVLLVDVLADSAVTDNPANRCYYCKRRIFTRIMESADLDGYSVLLDGTNASDDVSDRPGMKALAELQVLSPLRLCGLTKEEAENFLFSLGFTDFRVRTVDNSAKIRLTEADVPHFHKMEKEIVDRLSQLYDKVWLDSEVRR